MVCLIGSRFTHQTKLLIILYHTGTMANYINFISTDIDTNVSVGRAIPVDNPDICANLLEPNTGALNVIVQNIRSIGFNFDGFITYLTRLKIEFDMIILTECWIPRAHNLPSLPHYTRFASTRHINQSSGVVIYVSESIQATVYEPQLVDADGLVVRIGDQCAIVAIYRSPSVLNIDKFMQSLHDALGELKNIKALAVTGDLNVDIKDGSDDPRYSDYLTQMSVHGLLPSHTLPTRGPNCLDHFFLSVGNEVITLVCENTLTDHNPIVVSLKCKIKANVRRKTITKTDYGKAVSLLSGYDWAEVLRVSDPEDATCKFLEILSSVLARCTTKSFISNRKTIIKPWITPGLLRCMKWRDKLNLKLKKDPDNLILNCTYKRYRIFVIVCYTT